MKRVLKGEAGGRKPRSRLKSRLYVAWLMLVCVGILSAVAWMAPQEPATTGGGGGAAVGETGVKAPQPLNTNASARIKTFFIFFLLSII